MTRRPEEEFADALHRAGLRLTAEPVMDGRWHRAAVDGDKGAKRSGRYVGYLDGRPAGFIQNFKTGYAEPWASEREMPPLTPADRVRIVNERELRAVERDHDAAMAEREAYLLWLRGRPAAPDHPYLERKGVESHGLRQDPRGRLLLPARDATGWLGSVQTVEPDGTKLVPKDARKAGLAVPLGEVRSRRPLLIAEGYATAATLHEATGLPCLAAFDSGNLLPVALAWRRAYPHRRMVIAGDNDHRLPRRDPPLPNVGREKAREAAASVGAVALLPAFAPGDAGTDYNDFAAQHGREAVWRIVMAAVGRAQPSRFAAAVIREPRVARPRG